MSIKEVLEHDSRFRYMLLSRMQMDCDYFLGNGGGCTKYLWAGNPADQIAYMKAIYDSFPAEEKPMWLTLDEINHYARLMRVAS